MSHRANLVVVEHGRVEVRPDRHGAQSTPNLVLGGLENCVEVMRLYDPGAPYSPVWCEGLIMADLDHRELLLSGGDYAWNIRHSPGLRRAVLPIIASRWPGWTVRWADGGAFELAAYLGWDPVELWGEDGVAKCRPVPDDQPRSEQRVDWTLPYFNTLISVLRPDGTVAHHGSPHPVSAELARGPALVGRLSADDGEPAPASERRVGAGALLDTGNRRVRFWHGGEDHCPLDLLAALWPGWDLAPLPESYPGQLTLAGLDGNAVRLTRNQLVTEGAGMYHVDLEAAGVEVAALVARLAADPPDDLDEVLSGVPYLASEDAREVLRQVARSAAAN